MTSGQREVLTALRDGPRLVREVAAELWPHVASYTAYDRAHHRLRGLEDRGMVRRLYAPAIDGIARWELTHAGRAALELTAPLTAPRVDSP